MIEQNHILEVLNRIFKDKLCDQSIEINFDTTADDILEWNSLKHLVIILAIDTSWSIGTYNWGTAYRHQVTSLGFLPFIIAIIYEKKNLTNLLNE